MELDRNLGKPIYGVELMTITVDQWTRLVHGERFTIDDQVITIAHGPFNIEPDPELLKKLQSIEGTESAIDNQAVIKAVKKDRRKRSKKKRKRKARK